MSRSPIVRCATLDDVGAVAALVGTTPDALRGEIASFPAGVEWVALYRDGAVVAAGIRVDRMDPPALVRLCVDERAGPAAAELLVAAVEAEAARRGTGPAGVGLRRAPGVGAWLRARGYTLRDRFLELVRGAAPAPAPPLPADVVERRLDEVGPAAFLGVHNEAFRGARGHVELSMADWDRIARDPRFDPELVRVLTDDEGPVGFLRGAFAEDGEGVVETIGLAPRGRGRGLGRYLLRRTEALLRARGATAIGLTVAESNGVALALYRAEGYRERDRREVWEGPAGRDRPGDRIARPRRSAGAGGRTPMYKELTRHNRQQWLLEALAEHNRDLTVEARREKYVAMGASPFRFFRGTSHLFWADFYSDWQLSLSGGAPATQTWLQGDAHVYNFGAIADHEGQVIYGLDDFDDAIVGDYQYDLWRLAISLVLDAQERGVDEKDCRRQIYALGEGYLEGVLGGEQPAPSGMRVDDAPPPLRKFLGKVAAKRTRRKFLDKWTEVDEEGRRRFRRDHPKLEPATAQERKALIEALAHYRDRLVGALAGAEPVHFTVKDVARRLKAGTGSLGSRRFYVLIEGDGDGDHDDVILDVKEQSPPAAYARMTEAERARYRELFSGEGERHAAAFSALSSHPDRYLGWLTLDGTSFSVRERSPFKKDFPTEALTSNKKAKRMARIWGELLGRHHRQAARHLNDGAPIFEQGLGGKLLAGEDRFLDLLADLAEHYTGCVGHDYAVFLENRERLIAGGVPD